MTDVARFLIFSGIILIVIGLVILLLPKINFRGLPGDIYIQKDNFIFFFPVVTSILVSIILSIIISLIVSIFRK
ncbi:MAG: DUF2905 family protein [Brevinematia bacterium]